jgi:hypothetical protein
LIISNFNNHMNTVSKISKRSFLRATLRFGRVSAGLLVPFALLPALCADNQSSSTFTLVSGDSPPLAVSTSGGGGTLPTAQQGAADKVLIERLEPARFFASSRHDPVPYLGLSTAEASETLISQLGLPPGVGLEVTYVAQDSPAAKSGIEKSDVLVRFNGQSLVHPLQLRKLVQVGKEGDRVNIDYYRHGKELNASVTLAKTASQAASGNSADSVARLRALDQELSKLQVDDAIRDQMKSLENSLGNMKSYQKSIQDQVRRSVEDARRAYEQALRAYTNSQSGFKTADKQLKWLSDSGVVLDNDASVTVRTSGKTARSLVKADDFGTIVIVANPDLRLTAHDKQGKLLFDGDIQTDDQRSKVPSDLWKKVEPLVKKMKADAKAHSSDTSDLLEDEPSEPDSAQ